MIGQGAKIEAVVGIAVACTPVWCNLIDRAYFGLEFTAALCGAVVGVFGVARIIARWRQTGSFWGS